MPLRYIYYKFGTHVGFETTAAAWTLLGAYSTTGLGAATLTPMLIPINLNVDARCRVAFYITNIIGTGMQYTIGTGVGNTAASDANVRICEGTGKSYPFNLNFTPQTPNIRIYYNSCADGGLGCGVLPVQSILLDGNRTSAGALLQWQVEGEGMTQEYRVEGTNDLDHELLSSDESSLAPGVVWNTVATIPASGKSGYFYADASGYGFYRVVAIDNLGGTAYTRVVEMLQDPMPTLQVMGNQVHIFEEQTWELAL